MPSVCQFEHSRRSSVRFGSSRCRSSEHFRFPQLLSTRNCIRFEPWGDTMFLCADLGAALLRSVLARSEVFSPLCLSGAV